MKYAISYFYSALTLKSEDERNKEFGKLFESIGHMIHHIQDMAQPEHTRNDPHCNRYKCLIYYDPSLFEKYTEERSNADQLVTAIPYAIPHFDDARSYWHVATGDQAVASGTGLAEFSNRNFISMDTNFQGTAYAIEADSDYPRSPNGADAKLYKFPITNLLGPVGPSQSLQGDMTFIGTPVFDANTGETVENQRTSSNSIFSADLESYGFDKQFSVNRFTMEAALEFLIPRAVAYSAGLIDYFFRGRLQVESIDEVIDNALGEPVYRILVKNTSQGRFALKTGFFEVHYDALDGLRKSLQIYSGGNVDAIGIANAPTRLLKVSIPADREPAKPLILVYRGIIGEEEGLAGIVIEPDSPIYVLDNNTSVVSEFGPDGLFSRIAVQYAGRSGLSSFHDDHYTAEAGPHGALLKNTGTIDPEIDNPNDTSVNGSTLFATDVTGSRGDLVLLHRYDHTGNKIAADVVNPGYGLFGGEVHVAANDTRIATTHNENLLIYDHNGALLETIGGLDISSQEVAATRDRIYAMNGGTVEVYDLQGNFIGPATPDVHGSFPCLAATNNRLYVVETEWQGSTRPRKNTIHIYAAHFDRNAQGDIIDETYEFLQSVDISAFTAQPRSCSVDQARILAN